jgi:hypothetical protein
VKARVRRTKIAGVIVVGALLGAVACAGDDSAALPVAAPDASVDATVDAAAALCPVPANAGAHCTGMETAFTFVPPLAAACTSGDGGDAGDAGCTSSDASFTAAACRAFAAAEASAMVTASGARAPTIAEPSEGEALAADHWAIFAWTKAAASSTDPTPVANAPGSLSGDAYVLEFTVDCVEVLRVMLAGTSWVPDRAAWSILTAQTKPIGVRVVWMSLTNDAITAGPVASDPITITMAH